MKLPDQRTLKWFDKVGAERPNHEEHDTEDSWEHPLSEKLVPAKCWNWRQQGNSLLCDTDFGPMSQTIPTSHILIGEKDGLPVFKELVL